MIDLELGNTYGCKSIKEVLSTINELKEMGYSDAKINEILKRSKGVE